MPVSRVELQRIVGKLDADMRDMILHYPEPNKFLAEFNGHAGFILNSAGAADEEWARAEMDRILRKFGFGARVRERPRASTREIWPVTGQHDLTRVA